MFARGWTRREGASFDLTPYGILKHQNTRCHVTVENRAQHVSLKDSHNNIVKFGTLCGTLRIKYVTDFHRNGRSLGRGRVESIGIASLDPVWGTYTSALSCVSQNVADDKEYQ